MKFLVWSTVVCVVSFTLCGVFFGYSDFSGIEDKIESGNYKFAFNSKTDSKDEYGERTETYSASEVKKIEVKSSISEVVVHSENVEKVKMNVKFLNEDVEKTYTSILEDGVLKISTGEESGNQGFSSFFGNTKNGCKIDITIPKGLELDYGLKMALGSLEMEDLRTGAFEAKLAAGNIEVEDVTFKSAQIKAAAGNIDLDTVKVEEEMNIKAAAGNVRIKLAQSAPNLNIKAAAGNVKISLVSGFEPNLTFKSLSTVGELRMRKGHKGADSGKRSTYVYGDGKGSVEVKSTFGNVEFR